MATKLDALIEARNLPNVLCDARGKKIETREKWEANRERIKKILQEQEYGVIPEAPEHLYAEVVKTDKTIFASKATLEEIRLTATRGEKSFSFPVRAVVPTKAQGKIRAFVHINFRPEIPDKYQPTEEIVDRGFAVFTIYYNEISGDDGNFRDAGAKFLCENRRRKDAPGKIAMWAWAAMRVLDYIETRPEIDAKNVAVIGHSRLGKTALVTAAFDERFAFAISNDSGCSGAAITRGKIGEHKEDITRVFPYWFCPRYDEPTKIEDLPFEQHFLLSLIAPRPILVGSAEDDDWADPESEFLCLYKTNEIYALYEKRGLVTEDEMPKARAVFAAGDAGYHVRKGSHFLSREDWNVYMDFIEKKLEK